MSQVIDVAIIGAGGLTGRELLRWMLHHPNLRPVHITSDQYVGRSVSEVFGNLDEPVDQNLKFSGHSNTVPAGLPVFLATPNQESAKLAPAFRKEGRAVVDLSGSFRINDANIFESVYGFRHPNFEWAKTAVFGLPELFRDSIQTAHHESKILANPGCYPTGTLAALIPLKHLLKKSRHIIVDAKSGVSGAGGRVEDAGFSFGGVYENFRAYKILKHQHEPEIVQYAGQIGNFTPDLVFTPHLLPIFRGILSTVVIIWDDSVNADEVTEAAKAFCEHETFFRFCANPEAVELKNVQNTNYVDIGLRSRGNKTVIVTAIDNLVKGAAGQAIQNMNLMLDLSETSGLLNSEASVAAKRS